MRRKTGGVAKVAKTKTSGEWYWGGSASASINR